MADPTVVVTGGAGGIGKATALEAARVAGLTGVGMQAGPALSAVLRYRLETYWPPALRGGLCWRFLRCRGMYERRPSPT